MIEVLTYNIFTRQEEWICVYGSLDSVKPKDLKKERLKLKREYYKKVWEFTLNNDISALMKGKQRGFHKHHIDHIYPISKGFKNNIPPDKIGSLDNLRPLYWRDNLAKSARLDSGI